MFGTRTLKNAITVLAIVVGLMVPLTACVSGKPASPKEMVAETTLAVTSDFAAGACGHVDVPMLDIPTASGTEPRMRMPQPPGWEPTTEVGDLGALTQFALMSGSRAENEFPRNVVLVSLERVPDVDARTIFDRTRADLVQLFEVQNWPTDLTTTAGTVCGLPAETLVYAGDSALNARPATILWVVITAYGHTYLAAMTQTIEPGNPTYQRDAETILSGFEVLPPVAA
jgi:Probable lipoprotein LpqN